MKHFFAGSFNVKKDCTEKLTNNFEKEIKIDKYINKNVSLLSSRKIKKDGRVKVAFNGYILNKSKQKVEKYISEKYLNHGPEFVKKIRGSYRIALYDSKKDKLFLYTDKIGSKRFYLYEKNGKIVFSNSQKALLDTKLVKPIIDKRSLNTFLKSWLTYFSGDEHLIKNVKHVRPSKIYEVNKEEINDFRYWNLYNLSKKKISDKDAIRRIENILEQYINEMTEVNNGDLNVLFSGGLDSSFLSKFLKEKTDKKINAYTFEFNDSHLEDAEKNAEKLNIEHHPIKLEHTLPGTDEMKILEEPFFASMYLNPHIVTEDLNINSLFTGLTSIVTFPLGLNRAKKLNKFKKIRPILKTLKKYKILSVFDKAIPDIKKTDDIKMAAEVLGDPYKSSILTYSGTTRRIKKKRILSNKIKGNNINPEKIIDERHNLKDIPFEKNFHYLQTTEREGTWSSLFWQKIDKYDPFTYSPLVEFIFSLPLNQIMKRRLEIKLARKYLPKEIINIKPSGHKHVVNEFLKPRINKNLNKYLTNIEDLLDRGYFKKQRARELLIPKNTGNIKMKRTHDMITYYLLEIWFKTFID